MKVLFKAAARMKQIGIVEAWEVAGVQGVVGKPGVRLHRQSAGNARFGKALNHLEDRFSRNDFAREPLGLPALSPRLTRLLDELR